jgi:hypothetical protein
MTTTTQRRNGTAELTSRTPLVAVIGVALAALLTALGTFWDITGNDSEPEKHPLGQYLVVLAIIGVVAVVCYGLVVRRAMAGNPGRRSAILGAVALISVAAFWSGAPVVLASAAVATALIDGEKLGSVSTPAKIGVGLAGLTTLAAIGLAIAG